LLDGEADKKAQFANLNGYRLNVYAVNAIGTIISPPKPSKPNANTAMRTKKFAKQCCKL
jgi:hypothetical protein